MARAAGPRLARSPKSVGRSDAKRRMPRSGAGSRRRRRGRPGAPPRGGGRRPARADRRAAAGRRASPRRRARSARRSDTSPAHAQQMATRCQSKTSASPGRSSSAGLRRQTDHGPSPPDLLSCTAVPGAVTSGNGQPSVASAGRAPRSPPAASAASTASRWSLPRVSSTSSTAVSRTCRSSPSRTWADVDHVGAGLGQAARAGRAGTPGRSGSRVSSTSRRPASVSWRRAIVASSPGSTLPPESTATVVPRGAGSTRPAQQRRDATPRPPPPPRACSAPSAAPSPPRSPPRRRPPCRRASARAGPSVSSPRALDRDAVGDRQRAVHRHRLAAPQRLRVGRARRRLDADDLDLGARGLDGDARCRSPARRRRPARRRARGRSPARAARGRPSPARPPRRGRRTGARRRARLARARLGGGEALVDPRRRRRGRWRPGRARPRPWPAARRRGRRPRNARRARPRRTRRPGRGCPPRRRRRRVRAPSSPSAASLAAAPRTLNEPVRWRFSALSATTPPARSENVREDTIGVWRATASTAGRAASTSRAVDGHPESATTASISTWAPERQRRHADRHAGGRLGLEERPVDLVDLVERAHVGEVDGDADRVGQRRARRGRDHGAGSPGSGAPALPTCSPTSSPDSGSSGTWPEMNSRSPVRTAWEYGPTAAGAPSAVIVSR